MATNLPKIVILRDFLTYPTTDMISFANGLNLVNDPDCTHFPKDRAAVDGASTALQTAHDVGQTNPSKSNTSKEKVKKKILSGFLDADATSSRQGEFHPKPLTEPYVNLSIHTALVIPITV